MDGAVYYVNLAINGVVEGLIVGLLALAINLVFAVARFPNAAAGDVMTVGAYAGVGVQALGSHNLLLQGIAAIGAGMAVSLLSYVAVFRKLGSRSLVASLLASVGIAFFARSMLTLFVGQSQRVFQIPIARAMNFGGVRLQPTDLWLAAVALACVSATFALLFLTPIGRRMRAIADNPELARASGIRAGRVMVALWLTVGAIAGIGGMVLGIKTVVTPDMGWELLLPAFAAAVLGGVGSPVGAVLAGIVLGAAQELSTPLLGFTYKIALAFVVLAAILVVRPQGLFGTLERVR